MTYLFQAREQTSQRGQRHFDPTSLYDQAIYYGLNVCELQLAIKSMIVKPKVYLYEFQLYVPRAEIHLKFPCTFFLTWTQESNSVNTKQSPVLLSENNIAFNARLFLRCEMIYDCSSHQFLERPSNLYVYLLSVSKPNQDEMLAGFLHINLAKCLNSSDYEIEKKYTIQKCPDKNGSITLSLTGRKIKEIMGEESTEVVLRHSRRNSVNSDAENDTQTSPEIKINLFQQLALQQNQPIQKESQQTDEKKTEGSSSYKDLSLKHKKSMELSNMTINRLNQELDELKFKNKNMEKQLESYKQYKTAIEKENNKHLEEIQMIENLKNSIISQLQQVKQQKELLQKDKRNIEAKFTLILSQKDKIIQDLEKELQSKQNISQESIQNTLAKITELENRLGDHEAISETHLDVSALQQEIFDLKQQLELTESNLKQLTQRNQKLYGYEKRVKQLEEERNESFRSIQLLQKIINDSVVAVKQLQQQLSSQRSKNIQLSTKLTSSEYDLKENTQYSERLKEEFTKVEEAYMKLLEDLKYYQKKQQVMEQNFKMIERSSGNLIQQLKFKSKSEQELNTQIEDLQKQLNEAYNTINTLQESIQEKSAEKAFLQQSLRDAHEQNDSLQHQIQNLTAQVKILQQNIQKQIEQNKSIAEKYSEAQRNEAQSKKLYSQTLNSYQKVVGQNAKLKDKFDGVSSIILELNEQLELSKSEAQQLRSQLQMKDIAFRQLSSSLSDLMSDNRFSPTKNSKKGTKQASSQISLNGGYGMLKNHDKQMLQYQAEIEMLHESLFEESSSKHEAELKYEQLLIKYQSLSNKLKQAQKKFSQSNSGYDNSERIEGDQQINYLLTEVKGLNKQNQSYLKIIQSLRESETLNLNEIQMLKIQNEELNQLYHSLLEQNNKLNQKLTYNEQKISEQDLSQILSFIQSVPPNLIEKQSQIEKLTLKLLQINRKHYEDNQQMISEKRYLQQKILQLSKQFQKLKSYCLTLVRDVTEKKRLMVNLKPFQETLQSIQTNFGSLLNKLVLQSQLNERQIRRQSKRELPKAIDLFKKQLD